MRWTIPVLLLGLCASPAKAQLRWIAAGGGSQPEFNQVSLEQDLQLAKRALGPRGKIMFAGGHGTDGVQVLDRRPRGDSLLRELGQLFQPRGGRDAHYRKVNLPGAARASVDDLLALLEKQLESGTEPLLLYLATHGTKGEQRRENKIELWGGWSLSVSDLVRTLEGVETKRMLRVVVSACYSGGFAELAFTQAEENSSATTQNRCGLFAATWDRESSGCDPNPDRRAQRGFTIHFLNALQSKDRHGKHLSGRKVDLDGDGQVTLLEAHARARIASESFDVPTTTSERWLRVKAPAGPAVAPVELPEEDAVIAGLTRRLGLDRASARVELDTLEYRLEEVDEQLGAALEASDAAYWGLAIDLLERWPVLDDPYHPDFARTVKRNRRAIRRRLHRGPIARRHADAQIIVKDLQGQLDSLLIATAPIERLLRAYETKQLAGRLSAEGGPNWDTYQKLLACERTPP